MKKVDEISAQEFDRIFDEGEEDVMPYFDMKTARRPGLGGKRRLRAHRINIFTSHRANIAKRKKRRELHG